MRLFVPRPLCLLVLLIASGGFSFAQTARLPEPASYGSKISVRPDLAYGEAGHQIFDLYLPAGADRPKVVICWFGGAFWGGDKSHMGGVCAYLAAHGFAALAPGYALGAKDGSVSVWPQAVYDAKAAVRHVRANERSLQVDASRVAALGYSSGAYLAMMVGVTPNLTELEGPGVVLPGASRVSAVIAMAGVYDRRRDLGLPLALLGAGYEEKPDLRIAASPIIYVNPRTVPIYVLHGQDDDVADVSSATQLSAALRENRVPHELHLVAAKHYPITVEQLGGMVGWLRKVL
jgi:acetyl esterase/lipase